MQIAVLEWYKRFKVDVKLTIALAVNAFHENLRESNVSSVTP
jgi:hypothetical protein